MYSFARDQNRNVLDEERYAKEEVKNRLKNHVSALNKASPPQNLKQVVIDGKVTSSIDAFNLQLQSIIEKLNYIVPFTRDVDILKEVWNERDKERVTIEYSPILSNYNALALMMVEMEPNQQNYFQLAQKLTGLTETIKVCLALAGQGFKNLLYIWGNTNLSSIRDLAQPIIVSFSRLISIFNIILRNIDAKDIKPITVDKLNREYNNILMDLNNPFNKLFKAFQQTLPSSHFPEDNRTKSMILEEEQKLGRPMSQVEKTDFIYRTMGVRYHKFPMDESLLKSLDAQNIIEVINNLPVGDINPSMQESSAEPSEQTTEQLEQGSQISSALDSDQQRELMGLLEQMELLEEHERRVKKQMKNIMELKDRPEARDESLAKLNETLNLLYKDFEKNKEEMQDVQRRIELLQSPDPTEQSGLPEEIQEGQEEEQEGEEGEEEEEEEEPSISSKSSAPAPPPAKVFNPTTDKYKSLELKTKGRKLPNIELLKGKFDQLNKEYENLPQFLKDPRNVDLEEVKPKIYKERYGSLKPSSSANPALYKARTILRELKDLAKGMTNRDYQEKVLKEQQEGFGKKSIPKTIIHNEDYENIKKKYGKGSFLKLSVDHKPNVDENRDSELYHTKALKNKILSNLNDSELIKHGFM